MGSRCRSDATGPPLPSRGPACKGRPRCRLPLWCAAPSAYQNDLQTIPLERGPCLGPPSVGGTRTMERGTRVMHLPSLHAFRTIPIFVARMSQKVWDSLRYSVSGEHM